MKKASILFIVLLTYGITHAQKLELGVHGGFGYNTMPGSANRDSILPISTKFPFNANVSINAITNIGRWQAGIGLDIQKITYTSQNTKFVFADPGTTLYLLGNYKFGSHFYVGLNAGLYFASNSSRSVYNNNSKIPDLVYAEPGKGFAIGYQVGYSYPVSSKLNLNIEVGDRMAVYNIEYETANNTGQITKGDDRYSYVFGYLNVGIRLKLFTDPFNQWLPYKRVR